jgi:Spy/CpxP family protein refolding chaperone
MRMNLGPRGQAAIVLALVATLGGLIGILGDRTFVGRAAASTSEGTELVRPGLPGGHGSSGGSMAGGPWRWEAMADARYAERLAGALELTPEQRTAINGIVEEQQARVRELTREVEPRFRAIAGETRDRVEAVLTDEQRTRLRAMREDRVRMRPERFGPGGPWNFQEDTSERRGPRRRP